MCPDLSRSTPGEEGQEDVLAYVLTQIAKLKCGQAGDLFAMPLVALPRIS